MDFSFATSESLRNQNIVVKARVCGRFSKPDLDILLDDDYECIAAASSIPESYKITGILF
jgi:hypothetical protein